MFKMGLHYSFGHLKHKLWPKEWSGIDRIYLAFNDVWHTIEKISTRTITLLQIAHRYEVWLQSYGLPKSWESPLTRFWDSHLGILGKKNHLDVASAASHKVYYKGEGGGFPQAWAVVSLVCLCCMWFILTPKVLKLCINHLVWVVCRPMWMSEVCQLFIIPS
jgi:hypothetical protein